MTKNTSILAAFERLWYHVTIAVAKKANVDHNHTVSEITDFPSDLGASSQKTQVQIVTWEADD